MEQIQPRVPLELDVQFRRSYGRQNKTGVLQNISLSGAFLKVGNSKQLEKNDKMLLIFKVSGRIREITAQCIWKNETGCGVKFVPVNNKDIQIVDDLIYFVENSRRSKRQLLDGIFKQAG